MEVEPQERQIHRVASLTVSGNGGTLYVKIPKDLNDRWGYAKGDILTIEILRVERVYKNGEKK